MVTYKTKLIAGYAALVLVSLIVSIVDHFYVSRLYSSSSKVEDVFHKLDYFSGFQLTLERSLMPPTDYLIHGDPVEKANSMRLIKQIESMFEAASKLDLTNEEQALLKDAQTKFDDVKHLSGELFAIEAPVGNKAVREIEERMDALASAVQEDLEKIKVIRHKKTINATSNAESLYILENKIYWIGISFLIISATIIGLLINRVANDLERRTKQIETAKREWEDTFDAVKDFVTIHDTDYNIIRANKATAERFNATPQALIGKKCYALFHDTSEPHAMCPNKKTIETGKPAFVELDDPHLGGIFLTSTYPLINEKGEVYAAVHTMKDITEMRRADQKVKDEAEINKAVLKVAKFISSSMDEEAIVQEVVRITPNLVRCDRCVLFLWDDEQKIFLPMASHGIEDHLVPAFKALRFKPGDFGVLDEVKEKKASIVIEDPIDSPLMPSELQKTFNVMANLHTPIISYDEVIGIFGIDYTKEHHKFTHQEVAIVEGIAAQTGIALKNARLYRESMGRMMELERRMETIQIMHEVDKSILSTINRDEILEIGTRMVHRVIPSDRVTVVLVDKEATCFRYVAGFGIGISKGSIVSFEDTNTKDVLRTGRPILRPNIPIEKNLLPFDRRLTEQGLRSDIMVPIKVKGEIIAVLNTGSYMVGAFTPEHLSTAEKLAAQLAVALEHAKFFSDLQELLINTVKTLVSTVDAKSPWTRGHSERVTEHAIIIGKELGLSQNKIDKLRLAGLLHDIGKIGTAEYIIDKPGRLTDEEFAIMKEHPLRGAEILKPVKQFADIIPGVAYHHERFDGTGYQCKLKKEEIPLFGRILAAADAYDAMVSDRPYRKALGREKAIAEIKRCSGTQFDPKVADTFLKAVEKGLVKTG